MSNMQKIKRNAQNVALKTPDFASILIVDDVRYDRTRLKRMCEKLEFSVLIREAESLESLGNALELDRFDLIFVDFQLPDGSGLQALDAIRFHEKNINAATIMVTGNDQVEIAIDAMKNGCSDFLKKNNLSDESVRRAAINALQKANLSRTVEAQELMHSQIEAVLDHFTKECADDIKPMVLKMMRHVRDLKQARTDDDKFRLVVKQITNSCDRLLDFMCDIEDHDRKAGALSGNSENMSLPIQTVQLKSSERVAQKSSLFRRLFR